MGAQFNHIVPNGGNNPASPGAARVHTPCRAPEPVKSIPLGVFFDRREEGAQGPDAGSPWRRARPRTRDTD